MLALGERTKHSVVIFRRGAERRPDDQLALLRGNLDALSGALEKGAVILIEETRIRVRDLPISGPPSR